MVKKYKGLGFGTVNLAEKYFAFIANSSVKTQNNVSFAKNGFNDWKHYEAIHRHETSKYHCEAAQLYVRRIAELGNVKSLLTDKLEILIHTTATILVLSSYWENMILFSNHTSTITRTKEKATSHTCHRTLLWSSFI